MRNSFLLLAALAVFGCGGSDSNNFSSGGGDLPVVKIGVIAPLQAGLVDFGKGIRNSVQLAVDQANASGRFSVRFVVDARDDSSTPAVGQASAQALAADPQVIGVVGTYNSGVAAVVQPVLASAGIVMISPGNTNPTLTLGPDPSRPVRPFSNYFRLVVPDSIQGSELGAYAYNVLNVRNVAVVSEDKAVSLALVDAFTDKFTGLGGGVAIRSVFPDGTTDFTSIIDDVKKVGPDLIVFGGEYATAAPFRMQASAQGLTVALMGSDGIKDQAYITGAGPASNGDYASSVGAPIANQPRGAEFLSAYQAAGFAEPPSDFGPYAFDAAGLIIAAVDRRGFDRTGVVAEVQGISGTGVTGPLSFDAFGDTRNKVVTLYRVEGGVFVPKTTVTLP
ncbi:MAG: branched-chain amino acid ABC transporter substrate-binding protein [Candidatus Eremiobacteraeota bacterium]|nr:branched-chain amino acid ABC transporter substrate-binding protein [Candidatus Eremiobacteraeota bacterium]MCW5869787.1 branched-chain amino acid ABC transporter substrate-binding protein [Candidatus Eremiobacteraeota bacterium]